MSEQQITSAPPNSINVNKLGSFLDGWSEIVEGAGDKASQVRQNVLGLLQGRGMPDITLGNKTGYVSLISQDRRDYVVSETFPGAKTTIYIAKHGNDLYASWRTWIEPKLNWNFLRWILGGAAVLGLFTGGIQRGGTLFGPSETTFSFFGWLSSTFTLIVIAAFILAVVGRFFKGSFLAYFIIEPNVFDADDITAMSLSVHKSVLRALDSAGIDNSKLRLKQDFKGGRRNETV
jgi:hypothetical protein